MKPLRQLLTVLIVLFPLIVGGVPFANSAEAEFAVLWNFSMPLGHRPPEPSLFSAASGGALYGTTMFGGPRHLGSVFRLTPPPVPGAKGAGTVFKLVPPSASNPDWTLSVLHSFAGIDGARPNDTLLTDSSGALYGTTAYGGAHGQGTVFKLTPDASRSRWIETVLYSFSGADGAHPNGGLVSDKAGALYGTTYDGGRGTGGQGTVFKLGLQSGPEPHWALSTLHAFSGPDGGFPQAGMLFDKTGALLGTTTVGGGSGDGGVVFKLAPPAATGGDWIMTLLHIFQLQQPDRNDGWHPTGGLVLGASGAVYGTSFVGAGYMGGIYKLVPPTSGEANWPLTILHSLQDDDGQKPFAGLVPDEAGALYGTTTVGGQEEGGTVFRLFPAAIGPH